MSGWKGIKSDTNKINGNSKDIFAEWRGVCN